LVLLLDERQVDLTKYGRMR